MKTKDNVEGERTRQRILYEIQRFWDDYGYAPSIRELVRVIPWVNSTSVIRYHIGVLLEQGKVFYAEGKARTIRVLEK
jgi:SOS-response transcriptional repressor LexA